MKRKIKLLTIMTIILAATLVVVANQSASAADEVNKYKFKGKVKLRNKANTGWILQRNKKVKIVITVKYNCPEGSKPYNQYYYKDELKDTKTNGDGEYYCILKLEKGHGFEVTKYKINAYIYLGSSTRYSNGVTYTYTNSGERSYSYRSYHIGTNSKDIKMYRHTRVSTYVEPPNNL